MRRTTLWAQRGTAAWQRGATALFGIVQGGLDERLRERSARELVALDLPGYAIGGLSVGESREEMIRFARFTAALLPAEKPRYLMGVGTVRDLVAGDRLRRRHVRLRLPDPRGTPRAGDHANGRIQHPQRRLRPRRAARSIRTVRCAVCTTFSRAYLAHLFRSEELLGPRLLSYHNLAMLALLMSDARAAIAEDRWAAFRDGVMDGLAVAS